MIAGVAFLLLILGLSVVLVRRKGESTSSTDSPVSSLVEDENDTDVIIVGAGIAGCALAASLGRQGRKVTLFERDMSEPNRIVGELLQPGGVEHLRTLGLLGKFVLVHGRRSDPDSMNVDCLEGIDSPQVHGYAVFNGTESAELTYPPNSDGSLPIGRSFHHGRFVMKLREAAMNAPNVTVVIGTVNQLLEEGDRVVGVSYKTKDEQNEMRAGLVVACDGIFSKFRKNVLTTAPVSQSSFIGFVVSDLEV